MQRIPENLAVDEAEGIMETFGDRKNRTARTWADHREINIVMLATSLIPDSLLTA